MSVFESILVRDGRPVFLAEHLDRLRSACAFCGFRFDSRALESCADLLRDQGLARIYVTAGDGPVTGKTDFCRVFIFNEARAPVPTRVYHRGYDLRIAPEPHQPLFGGLKTANYWSNLDAFRRGVELGKNETLLFNHDGALISACMANVFVLHGSEIKTPSLNSGARTGVVREWIFRHRDVSEEALSRTDVESAEEIFLTSSWLGVMPVASLNGRPLRNNAIGRALHREYENALKIPAA